MHTYDTFLFFTAIVVTTDSVSTNNSRHNDTPKSLSDLCIYFLFICLIEHGGPAGTQFRPIRQTHADWRFDCVQTGAVDQASSVLPRAACRGEYRHQGFHM